MLYTQTSLSLVYNLERVSKSLHCYFATYQFGIVAWLRLEPKNYSTKLYSLHRRCSFRPVAVALGQLSESFVLSAALLLLGVVCVALDLLLGVGGGQMSLSLRAGRAALAEDMGMRVPESDARSLAPPHTPSIAFRHLPPNSARFSYATEGALFISAQLSTDAVSALRKVRVLIRLWRQPSTQART